MQLSQLFIKHPDHMCVISSDRHWEFFCWAWRAVLSNTVDFSVLQWVVHQVFWLAVQASSLLSEGSEQPMFSPECPTGPRWWSFWFWNWTRKVQRNAVTFFLFAPCYLLFFSLGLPKMCLSCCPCLWSSLEFCVALDSEKKRKKKDSPHG